MPDDKPLIPADPSDLQATLERALSYYSGHPRRRQKFTQADDLKTTITAGHLATCLKEAGFVIMRRPPASWPPPNWMSGPDESESNDK
jgi:hypothetical protein